MAHYCGAIVVHHYGFGFRVVLHTGGSWHIGLLALGRMVAVRADTGGRRGNAHVDEVLLRIQFRALGRRAATGHVVVGFPGHHGGGVEVPPIFKS